MNVPMSFIHLQSISNVVWALGKLRWHDGPLLAAATDSAAKHGSEYGAQVKTPSYTW